MSAGDWFLSVMSVGYLAAAAAYAVGGNYGYAVALTAYAVANAGLIAAAR
jgi:hypothetical protein